MNFYSPIKATFQNLGSLSTYTYTQHVEDQVLECGILILFWIQNPELGL